MSIFKSHKFKKRGVYRCSVNNESYVAVRDDHRTIFYPLADFVNGKFDGKKMLTMEGAIGYYFQDDHAVGWNKVCEVEQMQYLKFKVKRHG